MTEFKVGDWVRYKFEVCGLLEGTISRIEEDFQYGSLLVRTLGGRGYYASVRELEPWTPRVGERVRSLVEFKHVVAGDVLTVVHVGYYVAHCEDKNGERTYMYLDEIEPCHVPAAASESVSTVAATVDAINEEYGPVPAARKLIRTKNSYGFELARHGDYVWVDVGQKAPITVRAGSVSQA